MCRMIWPGNGAWKNPDQVSLHLLFVADFSYLIFSLAFGKFIFIFFEV
jgi:hypothetical protein